LSAVWFIVFVAGAIYNLFVDVSDQAWMNFWHLWVIISFVLGFAVTVWLLIGGIINLGDLFRNLTSAKRDYHDDGVVGGQHDVDNNKVDCEKVLSR